jgi:hypothetical protein
MLAEDKNGLLIQPPRSKTRSSNELGMDHKSASHTLKSVLEVDETSLVETDSSDEDEIVEQTTDNKLKQQRKSEMINYKQAAEQDIHRLMGFTKSVSLLDSEALDPTKTIKILSRPTMNSGSMRGLRYVESAVPSPDPLVQKLMLASTLVDQVTLP